MNTRKVRNHTQVVAAYTEYFPRRAPFFILPTDYELNQTNICTISSAALLRLIGCLFLPFIRFCRFACINHVTPF